jgi:hypothetical protein
VLRDEAQVLTHGRVFSQTMLEGRQLIIREPAVEVALDEKIVVHHKK